MRQIDKLHSFIKNPLNYGIRKNSRVYKCVCNIACNGIATTGYSDKDTKHIETEDVMRILKRLGVACGERVFLNGKVRKDCITSYEKFRVNFLHDHSNKNDFDSVDAFIASLQK